MRTRIVTALLLALAPVAGLAAPAQATAGPVVISRVYFDSPGSDTGSNSSLNDEYIRLTNYGTDTKSISGWTIKDANGYRYTFGTFSLKGGASVTVHSGKGTNTSAHRYWGRSWYVWNNTGDTAYLYNASGTQKDRCSFTGAGDYTNC